MFCSRFFSLWTPLLMLLLSFFCFFLFFFLWIFVLLQPGRRLFSRWLSAVALPCFPPFAVVAVAARLNVFMARISANMQSDHNLLNVFFAGRWAAHPWPSLKKEEQKKNEKWGKRSAHCEWSNAVCHTRAVRIYGRKQRTRHINRN